MSLFDQLRRSILGKNEQTPSQDAEAKVTKPPVIQDEQGTDRRRRRRVDARKGTRVLIIDDSPTIVAALRKLLNSAKYVTYEAFDAESGLQIAQAEQPELIFLDIVLPGMNGFAALRLMRRDPKTQHIPIIMISGNEQATEQFYANRIGADDFMKKPFSRFEVFARIERLLDANKTPRRKGATEEATAAAPAPRPAPQPPVPQAAPAQPASQVITPAQTPAAPIHQPTAPAPNYSQSVTMQAAVAQPAYAPQVVIKPAVQPTITYAAPIAPPVTPPVVNVSTPSPAIPPQPIIASPIPPAATQASTATAAPTQAPSSLSSPLEARKELTLMGLQYFDQQQFIAAIKRGDKLAFELFVAGGGVELNAEVDGKTPLQIARENGRTQIFAILRSKLATMNS